MLTDRNLTVTVNLPPHVPPPTREVLVGTWQFAVGAGADSTVRYFDPSATQRAAVAAFNPPFSEWDERYVWD